MGVRLEFLTNLNITSVRGENTRRLLDQFVAKYDGFYIVVPTGFTTDYASIPEFVPRFILDQDDAYIREAAVIHDYLYSTLSGNQLSRYMADVILYEGMITLGAPRWKAELVYLAVRTFGWLFYKKDKA